jgi:hypothetical protein
MGVNGYDNSTLSKERVALDKVTRIVRLNVTLILREKPTIR